MGAYTRELFRKFVRELPWMLAIWAVVSIGFGLWNTLTGERSLGESLKLALVFLPIVIPVAPLAWLRYEPCAWTPRAFPAIALGCAWLVLGIPVAVLLSTIIGRLVSL
jgi:hypothetical protein